MNKCSLNKRPHILRQLRMRTGLIAGFAIVFTSVLSAQTTPTDTNNEEDVFVLSPFEVVANNTGYFQSSMMSGTRLNSKIEDIGMSISVMTKDQMDDFAMLDVNDVFDYMANTEGANTYSDFVVDRTGAVTDNVSFNPNNANRVRGIGSANIAFNNIAMSSRVPVDPLWLDSIEVSRGPNANIFGLGNASGTVNQVAATASLYSDFNKLIMRGDSYGGWRTSLDVNRIILKDKLSVRASAAYQHTAFQRKPSGEDIKRFSAQMKAKPFENTTVSLSWYGYNAKLQRPNFTTPRDNITGWLDAGAPAWDPTTRLIVLDGVTYGAGEDGSLDPNSTAPIMRMPSYFTNSPSDGRSIFQIGHGGEAPYWTIPTITNATTPAANGVGNDIQLLSTAPVNSYGSAQPLFGSYAALADKSIYNWEKINLQAANTGWDKVDVYMAQVDHIFINTPRHMLAGQATYLLEDADRVEDYPLGPASVNGVIGDLRADPNLTNLDGTPNPYFGRPYLRSKEPYLREKPLRWETQRAQLAYKLDLTQNEGWSKHLGTHQLLAYYEHKDQRERFFSWRRTAVDGDADWLDAQFAAGIPLGNRSSGGNAYPASANFLRNYDFYYVGDTVGGGVEYAPSAFPLGTTVPFTWGNPTQFNYDRLTIDYSPAPDGSGGGRQTIVKTKGAVFQNNFLNDRIVTTFGYRTDEVSDRNKVMAVLTPDLLDFDRDASKQWQDAWSDAEGTTKTLSVVTRPFKDMKYFENMKTNGSGFTKLIGEAATSLSLTYNRSDNFIPQGPAFNLLLESLPNQTGESKDYGLWLTLLDGKLSIRYNHFKTEQINLRNGDISTIAQRVLRPDGILNSNNHDRWNLQDRSTDWVTWEHPDWSEDQIRAEVANIMGISSEVADALEASGDSGRTAATQDVASEGDELEINFNPSRNWTISASVTKIESINKNAGSVIEDWINERNSVWNTVEDMRFTAADAPDLPTGDTGHLLWRYIAGTQFTQYGYHASSSADTYLSTNVAGPLSVYRQLEGRPRPQLSKYSFKINTKYRLAGITDHKILKDVAVGGSLRWSDKKAIGFLGVQSLPDRITELDTNRPVFSDAETYVDLFVSYSTKLWNGKIPAHFQFNVKNAGESGGGLRVTQVFPDGSPLAYRIIDPRTFVFSISLDL